MQKTKLIINISTILGYSSSSSGGAGLYNSNTYDGQTYGPKYPYSNQYSGYAGGANAFPFYQPAAPFATPYDFQNAFQQYYNQLSSFNAKYGPSFTLNLDFLSHDHNLQSFFLLLFTPLINNHSFFCIEDSSIRQLKDFFSLKIILKNFLNF